MLLRGLKLTLFGAAGVLVAGAAFADDHESGRPKFGLEYRAGVTYDDGKIHETDGVDAEDHTFTEISVEAVKVTAVGEVGKDVNYMFRYDALQEEVEHANARLQWNKMIGFSIGRTKVNQGGWHAKDHWEEYNNVESRCGDSDANAACEADFAFAYANSQAFGAYDDVLALHLALAGELTLQLLDDVSVSDTDGDGDIDGDDNNSYAGYKNKANKGPAATLEWVGNFSGWMPIVQISSYDLNNSQSFSLGVKGMVAGLGLSVGYNLDNRNNNLTDETDTFTGVDAHFSYALGSWTPWVSFHSFEQEQGGTDADQNDAGTNGGLSTTADDNAQAIALGVKCNAVGDGYVPYVTLLSSSGKFNDSDGDEETRTGLALKLGIMGKF